jgi:alcohol dehydrogenase
MKKLSAPRLPLGAPGHVGRVAPLSWVRHLVATASPMAVTATRVALEEHRTLRTQRLTAAVDDRMRQRVRATRPKMRALSVTPGGSFAWRSVAAPPAPGPLGAIVRPIAVATCDLDRPLALGRTPFPLPLHFGHECVAEVLAVGAEVSTVTPGDRVVVPFQISCGRCTRCQGGLTANCESVPPVSMYGFGVGGGHWGGAVSDQLAVPYADGMLVPLPAALEPAAAASVADTVSDAYRHIGPHLPGLLERDHAADVIVVGPTHVHAKISGSVPLYAGLIARAFGASEVRFLDARPAVRSKAEQLGFIALPHTHRPAIRPATLVVDASGTPSGLRGALRLTARDGICSSVGGLHSSGRLPIGLLYGRNVTLSVARAHARTIIPDVLELMVSGRLQPQWVTTHVGQLDDAPSVLREHVLSGAVKTILTVT